MSKSKPLPPRLAMPQQPPSLSLPADFIEQIEQIVTTRNVIATLWEHHAHFMPIASDGTHTINRFYSLCKDMEPAGWELIAVVPHEQNFAGILRGWMTFWKRRKPVEKAT